MNKITNEKEQLLKDITQNYDMSLNDQILKIIISYILLSISWNLIFRWFDIPYSRATISVLIVCFAVSSLIFLLFRFTDFPLNIKTHIVLLFIVFVIISLYYGSGYSEAWSYFLLIPIINSLYGKQILSVVYSLMGLLSLAVVSIAFPVETYYTTDGIDISNRILLYIIVATFSYLLLSKLNLLYNKQANTVIQSMETTLEQVVQSFVVAMEAKDHYTFGHSERVSLYAVALAKNLPEYQDKEKLKHLRLSGLLHDVGKISISEHILTKTTTLTAEEYDEIKTHTTFGAQMVEKIEGLKELKTGVLYHHERWDGKGYPTGAKGEAIPLEARILAVADSFDAMTSTRSYRDELSVAEAFDQLESGLGTQYDPNLSQALKATKKEFAEIYADSHDALAEFEKLTDFL